jgi:hypothetical protein
MTTARDLIEGALRLLTVKAAGETLPADQAADGLQVLNDMLGSWNNEPAMLYFEKDDSLTLTGQQTYTIGPGGDIDTTRPLRITDAFVRNQGIDYPVNVVGDNWYADVAYKATSGRPEYLQYDADYPLGTIKLWPVGDSSYTLYVTSHKQLPDFTNLSDTVNLPAGYERAIRYNLAIELAPEYGREPTNAIAQRANEAKRNIKRMNTRPPRMPADTALRVPRGRDYSIYSDQ